MRLLLSCILCCSLLGCIPTVSPIVQDTVSATATVLTTPLNASTPTSTSSSNLASPQAEGYWKCDPSGGAFCFGYLTYIKMLPSGEGWALGNATYHHSFSSDASEPTWRKADEILRLYSIDMVSPTEGWALEDDRPVHMRQQNDGTWQYEKIYLDFAWLNDLDMLDATEGWAVGDGKHIFHYLDGEWQKFEPIVSSSKEDLRAVAVLSPTEAWSGPFFRYDGQQWFSVEPDAYGPDFNIGPTMDMQAIVETNEIWAVGLRGIAHYQNGQWYQEMSDISMNSISMISPQEGWAVGDDGMVHYQDGEWQQVTLPTEWPLTSISMINETEGWAVGTNGVLLQYQNGTWQLISQNRFGSEPYSSEFHDITWLEKENVGWAVGRLGFDGMIIHHLDGEWQLVEQIPEQRLMALDMITPNIGWAVGEGIIMHYQDGTWRIVLSAETNQTWLETGLRDLELLDIDMWDEATGFAVGQARGYRQNPGVIWHYQQNNWQLVDSLIQARLRAVHMVSPNEAWAVGEHGTILHYLDGQWLDQSIPNSEETFVAVQMLDRTTGWIAGERLLHYQNGQWTTVPSPGDLTAMGMLSDDEGWFVGGPSKKEGFQVLESYIWHYQDGQWSPLKRPLPYQEFTAIHMVNEHEGWMVGDAILQYTDAP